MWRTREKLEELGRPGGVYAQQGRGGARACGELCGGCGSCLGRTGEGPRDRGQEGLLGSFRRIRAPAPAEVPGGAPRADERPRQALGRWANSGSSLGQDRWGGPPEPGSPSFRGMPGPQMAQQAARWVGSQGAVTHGSLGHGVLAECISYRLLPNELSQIRPLTAANVYRLTLLGIRNLPVLAGCRPGTAVPSSVGSQEQARRQPAP